MTDEEILQTLLTKKPAGPAWESFLRRFSNLILKMIWQFDKDHDEAMEKYLYVCRKLAEKDFAILRRFRSRDESEVAPQFTTWLAAVTRNLCIDAHRAVHGRHQFPRSILRLSAVDREVFRLYYWKGYSTVEIEQQLANMPDFSAALVSESLVRIQESFTRAFRPEPVDQLLPFNEEDGRSGVVESETDFEEMLDWLVKWLDELSDKERMILRLRFWEDMSGAEIAAVMKISPEQSVYPFLQKTLMRLRDRAAQTYAIRKTAHISV